LWCCECCDGFRILIFIVLNTICYREQLRNRVSLSLSLATYDTTYMYKSNNVYGTATSHIRLYGQKSELKL
jgi:hypothetical protein